MKDKAPKIELELDLEDAILAFHRKVVSELGKEAKRLNFTASELEVLHFVVEQGNPTMKEIANHLQIKPPSVTTTVETLHRRGVLKREFDKGDKRIIRVEATPKFWKVFSVLKDKKMLILKNLFSKLNKQNKKELIKILNVITK